MSWNGKIVDETLARRASQCVLLAQNLGLIADGDLTSLAAAQAAVATNEALLPITQQIYAPQIQRALEVGDNFGAPVTTSSLSAFYAALPDNDGHARRLWN